MTKTQAAREPELKMAGTSLSGISEMTLISNPNPPEIPRPKLEKDGSTIMAALSLLKNHRTSSVERNSVPFGHAPESEASAPSLNRSALKKNQRESIVHVKCAYSHRNIAAIMQDDLTAADPLLNVAYILHYNCVPVPTHWRLRNGRFLSEHVPKYTVASKHQNVYRIPPFATEVHDPKELLARFHKSGQDVKLCKPLREVPIAYENRENWVTIPLLAHGDLYQETKQSIIGRSSYSPGVLSDELRKALNIGPNDPPPWLTRQSLLPKPSWLQNSFVNAVISAQKTSAELLLLHF